MSGYTWSVSSNITIISGQGTNSITVTAANNIGDTGTIVINNSNGTQLAYRPLWVGPPLVYAGTLFGNLNPRLYQTETYYVDFASPGLSQPWVTWTLTPDMSSNFFMAYDNWNNYCNIQFGHRDYYTLVAKSSNSCGFVENYAYLDVSYRGSSGVFYPNPVSDVLYIELTQPSAPVLSSNPTVYDIRLYDGLGNLLRQASANGGTVQFRVSDLRDGVYFLHVYDGVSNTPEIYQIVVEH